MEARGNQACSCSTVSDYAALAEAGLPLLLCSSSDNVLVSSLLVLLSPSAHRVSMNTVCSCTPLNGHGDRISRIYSGNGLGEHGIAAEKRVLGPMSAIRSFANG